MNQLAEKILEEIRIQGAIPFARFMELALYCPVYGYYETEEDTVGRTGDYYTSVSVGPLFGQLLAWQFAEWLKPLAATLQPLRLVEAGAHQGHLARDILTWLRAQQTSIFETLEYWIVEPSIKRQEWQQRTLADFASKVLWARELGAVGTSDRGSQCADAKPRVHGIIFSNELLDSMPVHRFGWDAKRFEWFQWAVTADQGQFIWTRLDRTVSASFRTSTFQPDLPAELLEVLPDGFIAEVCPAAQQWWSAAAAILASGKLMTVDYGLTLDELLVPERANGTLRGYRNHQQTPCLLADPGQRDITAHVNFSTIQQAGEAAGLKTISLSTQEQFLTRIAGPLMRHGSSDGFWSPEQIREFQTLTNPNHLGTRFRVLVQSR